MRWCFSVGRRRIQRFRAGPCDLADADWRRAPPRIRIDTLTAALARRTRLTTPPAASVHCASVTLRDAAIGRGTDHVRREDQTSLTATPPAPLVSIITPTYNHALYIGRCLESVLAQTEPRWEQIVVDDGSTDGTAEIVKHFADARIRYVAQPHRGISGLGDAYNLALDLARGEFVAILEGDDFWPQDKLERQLPEFEDPEVVLSWGLAAETDPAGEARRLHPAPATSAGTSTGPRRRRSGGCSREIPSLRAR